MMNKIGQAIGIAMMVGGTLLMVVAIIEAINLLMK